MRKHWFFCFEIIMVLIIRSMPSHFSPQLIQRTQAIFEKRSGLVVDEEQAEMILERLARLGLLMGKLVEMYEMKNRNPHTKPK